ncbi:MAG: hypothetical protein Q4E61_03505 [Alphaproteobacteria bacterium]|nr:hypothetical protein [Alphaproteobacteria bacterium]
MEKLRLLKVCLAVSFCLLISFINYFITQIVGGYFFPLTMLAIFYCFIIDCPIPASLIFMIGLFDDILLNSFVGTYSLTYSIMAYLLLKLTLSLKQKRILNLVVIVSFLFINYITFCYF